MIEKARIEKRSYYEFLMAPWPGFEPGSRYIAFCSVMSGGRQPPILDLTVLPGLSEPGAESDKLQ